MSDRTKAAGGAARHSTSAILALASASYGLIVVDASIVITGLPNIRRDLGFTPETLSWAPNAYTLTFGGFMLLAARAGDMFGVRRTYLAGLALFAFASTLVGLAPDAATMVAARALQGLGAATLATSSLALLQRAFPPGPARTRALAIYTAAAAVGASLGLVAGGLFADLLSWRVGFLVNAPIALGLWLVARRQVTGNVAGGQVAANGRARDRLDVAGALTSTLGMTTLVYAAVRSAEAGWSDPAALAALGVSAVSLAVFATIETRVARPIMPPRLLASLERTGAYAARMLYLGANFGFFFFSTQYMQVGLGYRPAAAGLAYLPAMLVNVAAARAVPALIRRLGNGRTIVAGFALSASGMAWLSWAGASSTYLGALLGPTLLIGAGQGLAFAPLTSAGIAGVADEDAGAASGLLNAAHQLGGSLGIGALVSIAALGAEGTTGVAFAIARLRTAMEGATGFVLVAVLVVAATIMRNPAARDRGRRTAPALPSPAPVGA
ncbi:MAG: MFS transporter [Hyphomicrobiales bacterium]|nr:MFS transporter [Hyphomicrobiales bacterium]